MRSHQGYHQEQGGPWGGETEDEDRLKAIFRIGCWPPHSNLSTTQNHQFPKIQTSLNHKLLSCSNPDDLMWVVSQLIFFLSPFVSTIFIFGTTKKYFSLNRQRTQKDKDKYWVSLINELLMIWCPLFCPLPMWCIVFAVVSECVLTHAFSEIVAMLIRCHARISVGVKTKAMEHKKKLKTTACCILLVLELMTHNA